MTVVGLLKKNGRSLTGYTMAMAYCRKGTFAFLTMESMQDFCADDHLVRLPLEELGWGVEFVPWRSPGVAWERFAGVIIRSTWDYQQAPEAFLAVLEEIVHRGVPLENALDTVRWNLEKHYLADLGRRGIPVVPTHTFARLDFEPLVAAIRRLAAPEVVLKPVVGANADHAFRLRAGELEQVRPRLEASFANRPFLLQPFRDAVTREGEFSLFFFDGDYSHSILKSPATGDFRSQEEHGATIRAVEPEPDLLAVARRAVTTVSPTPLYGRIDFVRSDSGGFELMEFELIEPSLYLRMDAAAPLRFAQALDRRFA